MSKRPWKKFAYVLRTEYVSGDVKFIAHTNIKVKPGTGGLPFDGVPFESLDEAVKHLDDWHAAWAPRQVKKVSVA